ncbi:PLP-dependent transferase [Hygrophoropsis aurantiaca]|uniref:PLP-dependent transferase n=1 Tax=Hygrophoropsis aurantiaca TaxID=72124 RepID=A0ACB8A1E1_9AGAM|nr:PLP-dependent transferase [Hygrophoropsis aurantiaca]
MSESVLDAKLRAALQSRAERNLLRRLTGIESPSTDSSSPSSPLIDFTSNDYLSLTSSPRLRSLFLNKLTAAPHLFGPASSRLLLGPTTAHSGSPHAALEQRIATHLCAPCALLCTSGFDANVSFFSVIPQAGDVIIHDELVHASVHDGIRAWAARHRTADSTFSFAHNSPAALHSVLSDIARTPSVAAGHASVFIAVESHYSMDGTLAPLDRFIAAVEHVFGSNGTDTPNLGAHGNVHLVIDEAHATGLYGEAGRGRVFQMQLQHRVLARVCTFGKALGASGAAILTTPLIRDYLINYARPIIYTTAPTYATVLAIDSAFDLLVDETCDKLAAHLFDLVAYALDLLRSLLERERVPDNLLRLPGHLIGDGTSPSVKTPPANHSRTSVVHSSPTPNTRPARTRPQSDTRSTELSPIIPLLTPHPHALSTFLLSPHNLSPSALANDHDHNANANGHALKINSTRASLPPVTDLSARGVLATPPAQTQIQGISARPITYPTASPRVRVCLHAGNTRAEVEALVWGVAGWVKGEMKKIAEEERRRLEEEQRAEEEREREVQGRRMTERGVRAWMEAKL